VPSDCLTKAILSLAACLSLYFGSQKIGTLGEATQTTPEPIKPAWLTLVYGSKSIDWIGDEKIMAAAIDMVRSQGDQPAEDELNEAFAAKLETAKKEPA